MGQAGGTRVQTIDCLFCISVKAEGAFVKVAENIREQTAYVGSLMVQKQT